METFTGDKDVKIVLRLKDSKKHKWTQEQVTEICLYNEQELQDLKNGIHRAVNNVRQGRT